MSVLRQLVLISPVLMMFFSCGKTVIKNVHVFDPQSGVMSEQSSVLIKGERIISVTGKGKRTGRSKFAKKIEGNGRYLIPGLIDAHAHLAFLLDSMGVKGETVMPLYLANGVTSVRDIGDGIDEQIRLRILAGKYPELYPAVYMCSPLIEGRYPYHGPDPVSIPITDTARVAGYIDSLSALGIRTVKIYVHTEADVYRKVIEEAHRNGLTVAAHLPSNRVSIADAISWGIDIIEHISGGPSDTNLISQMVRQGIMLDPTLVNFRNMMLFCDSPAIYKNIANSYMPDTVQRSWYEHRKSARWHNIPLSSQTLNDRKDWMEKFQQRISALHKAGVKLMAGTDSPEPFCPPGFTMHEELELLVECGLSPAEAIAAATINNAIALKEHEMLGTISAGKYADFLLLDADPLQKISNTRRISLVVHRGKFCDIKKLLALPRERKSR